MMWNEQLSLRVAQEIKRRYPNCRIIFGGAQVPHEPQEYFIKHPFIDFAKQTILWGRKCGRTLLKVEILKDQEVLIS